MVTYRDSVSTSSYGGREYISYSSEEDETNYADYYARFGSEEESEVDARDDDSLDQSFASAETPSIQSSFSQSRNSHVQQASQSSHSRSNQSVSMYLSKQPSVYSKQSVIKKKASTTRSFATMTSKARGARLPPSYKEPVQSVDTAPSIGSVATPSVDEDDTYISEMEERSTRVTSIPSNNMKLADASDMDSIVSSVMQSLMNSKKENPDKDAIVRSVSQALPSQSRPQTRNETTHQSKKIAQLDRLVAPPEEEEQYIDETFSSGGEVRTGYDEERSYSDQFADNKYNTVDESELPRDDISEQYGRFMENFQNKGQNIIKMQTNGLMKLQDEVQETSSGEYEESVRMESFPTEMAAPKSSGFFGFGKSKHVEQERDVGFPPRDAADSYVSDAPENIPSLKEMPSNMGSPITFKNLDRVSEQILDLRREADQYLTNRQFNELVILLQNYPELAAVQYEQSNARNLIHLIAIQNKAVPENVILKILSQDPSLVAASDDNGNTPLHYAALNAKKGNMHVFIVMLKFNPLGAMQRNAEGDLPLHLAAANCNRGSQMAVHLLLETNSKALNEPNNKGKIPLHLALTVGSKNLKSLKSILDLHKARHYNVDVKDNRGNTPLHTAIMNGTTYEAIELFNNTVGDILSIYTKENDQRFLPLHLALSMKRINPLIVLSLIKAAPFAAGVPTPSGEMPISLATKAELKPEIIKTLLAADMPIEIGTKRMNASMGAIVEREHGHSWWHIAVEKKNKYTDVVTSLLADYATYVQIVALARSKGPDKKTVTIDAASPSLLNAIKNLLRFYYRYEISTSNMPITNSEIQSFAAFDHGEELEQLKVSGPWLKSGFTHIRENPKQNVAVESNREISYVPWNSEEREVTLRCYAFEEQFNAEVRIREERNLSSDFIENMISKHNVSDYVNASFTSGKLLCISFERNEETIGERWSDSNARDANDWLSDCQQILRKVAQCIQHIHGNSLIHGRLDTNTVARFGRNRWKLLDIGGSTKMGETMSGLLLKCVPPESLSGVIGKTGDAPSPRRRSNSKSRLMNWKGKSNASKSVSPTIKSGKNLPPLPNKKATTNRKKFGVFVFGLKDLGLGSYGVKGRPGSAATSGLGKTNHDLIDGSSMDSSIASSAIEGSSATTDEASARVIAMQEDEISRLRKALEEKEHIYRHQLAEERASFKRQEVKRQRQLQQKRAQESIKVELPRFTPEKVMASALWDVWSFGLIMAEAIIGKSPSLPSSAKTDEEFLDKLSKFNDVQLSVVCEEVNESGGQLAADLVARLLNPKPQQRIASMEMALKHKYFHTQVVEISKDKKKRRGRNSAPKDEKTPRAGRRSLSLRRSQRRSKSRQRK